MSPGLPPHARRTAIEPAEATARLAVERDPGSAPAWATLGSILVGRGELAEARHCYLAAVQIDPSFVQALNDLAVVLQRMGQLSAAETRYREALNLAPEQPEIQLNLAALQGALGRHREALEAVDQVLARDPKVLMAYLLASVLELSMGRDTAALGRLERALAIAPDAVNLLTARAEILCGLGRCDAALEDCERGLSKAPNDARALHIRARVLQELNRPEAALEAFGFAEAAAAAPATVISDRAWLLAELGHKDEALGALRRAIGLQPDLSIAWYRRAYLRRYAPGDPDLALMEGFAGDPEITYLDRLNLCFALGRAYLDMCDGVRAFAWLDDGNRMKRMAIDYDGDADARRFTEIASIFSADTLSRLGGCGVLSTRPIFVFGMPRSGTTLVEQILASHRLVRGAGESTCLLDIAEVSGYPGLVPQLAPQDIAALGRQYLDRLGADVSDTLHFVDKTPMNFLYAGLISLILPGARMIHCRRDPLDTCLSCYSLLFVRGQEYSYDLTELGRFYRLYRQLMAHWRRVLAPGCLLEIDYEMLVDDTEGEVRRILDFCALPWDAACLRFHDTSRRVASASLAQVRSPIYTTSIGRAQAFRRWLEPLETALVDLARG